MRRRVRVASRGLLGGRLRNDSDGSQLEVESRRSDRRRKWSLRPRPDTEESLTKTTSVQEAAPVEVWRCTHRTSNTFPYTEREKD